MWKRLLPRAAILSCLVVLLSLRLALVAQTPGQQPPGDLQATLPLDTAVRTGTLPNGLKYFVRRNKRPENRVALRLAVKSGSLEEADDQQGLAHLIEHMAFNGSAHFKPGEIFSYFESVGARLGPHVNAYTSFDETVYMLELPSDRAEVVTKGLTALADYAGGLTLDAKEIDKERGVVIEEWRGRLGASSRVRDKQIPVLFYNSRYAERVPIGKPEIIRNAPPERLRAFYDTWYRPERMAVVAVGDIDESRVEREIAAAFGPLTARAPAAPVPDASVTMTHPLLMSVVTDPEVTQSTVQIISKRPKERETRVADYRRSLVDRLVERMLNDRFSELARKPDAAFLGAGASDSDLGPSVATFGLAARVGDGKIDDGLGVLVTEGKRAREFGFVQSELDRTRKWMAAFYQRAFAERDKTESDSFAQEYLQLFLEDEPAPGIEYEYRLAQQLLPSIGLADVSGAAKRLLADEGRVVLVVAPEKEGVKVPGEVELQAVLTAAESEALTAWTDTTADRELLETKPRPARIESRREVGDIGVSIVRFSNGVEAWLKPTAFKNDQVLFSLTAMGGSSLAPPADFIEASLASGFVRASGAGGLKAVDLQKILAGRLASASPFISLSTHGISGSAAPAELETALQLLYQQFTAPGDDPDAFAVMKRQLEAAVANRGRSPMQVFAERLEQINTSKHYIAEALTAERVAALDRQKMTAFYRQRFSNAADFTFFMVGAFKLAEALPLVAQYVGALPSTGRRNSDFKDIGVHFPASIERATVEKGREPRSTVAISFFADPPADPIEQERIIAATTVLDIALRDVLREDLGQTYTVSVGLDQSLPQRGGGYVRVSFGAAPENVAAMADRVFQEIRRLQHAGPSEDLTKRAREAARRGYETALQENTYWLGRLQSVHMFGRDPKEILTRGARIDAITPKVLQDAFKRYFPMDRYTVVTLMPAAAASGQGWLLGELENWDLFDLHEATTVSCGAIVCDQ